MPDLVQPRRYAHHPGLAVPLRLLLGPAAPGTPGGHAAPVVPNTLADPPPQVFAM